jgi:hypothetical protein
VNLDPIHLRVKVSPMVSAEILRWSREPLFIRAVRSDHAFEGDYPVPLKDGDEIELEFARPEPPR